MSDGYIVAFRGISETNGYKGIVTWTIFPSKAEFDAAWALRDHSIEEIAEEGITADRAVELVRTTPMECYRAAAMADATDPKTGKIDLFYLRHKTTMVNWIEQDREGRA